MLAVVKQEGGIPRQVYQWHLRQNCKFQGIEIRPEIDATGLDQLVRGRNLNHF